MEGEELEVLAVRKFVASRIEEIKAITVKISHSHNKKIGSERSGGLALQHVPRHMRRRAASHNPKRLPKSLRAAHIAQVAKSRKRPASKLAEDEKARKPKCRKFRRKHSNLLLDYNQRQRKFRWMETHIWHAKRFHMEEKWNYKVPIAPCEKGYRSLYRAAKTGVTMRDISFYSCLEMSGLASVICEGFEQLTSPSTSKLSLGAVFYKSGQREARLHIYKKNMYPFGYCGPVQFIWKPDQSCLWIWVHPAYKEDVLQEILACFQLSRDNIPETKLIVQTRDELKLEGKELNGRPCWTNPEQSVKLVDLEGALNRIRLHGPGALQGLRELLLVRSSCLGSDSDPVDESNWFDEYYNGKEDWLQLQSKMWSAIEAIQNIPVQAVIPLTVRDPRIFLPQKRTCLTLMGQVPKNGRRANPKAFEGNDPEECREILEEYWQLALDSPLWNSQSRERILLEKMSDVDLSKRRGQTLIPGSSLDLGREENQVPVILVNQPDFGVDLILPAGWTMGFWVSFCYRNVRVHGLRDSIHFAVESGSLGSEDITPPDTSVGREELITNGNEREETFFKQPSTCRTNLVRLTCPVPFKVDWRALLAKCSPADTTLELENSSTPEDFYVLRDIKRIQTLRQALDANIKKNIPTLNEFPHPEKCLVGIRVVIVGRGHPKEDSVICIPSENDLLEISKVKKVLYFEPDNQDDDLVRRRAEHRQKHTKHMAYLRKKRKAKKGQECASVYDSAEASLQYNKEMRALWTPDGRKALDSMTRDPIGYLTLGGESYALGKCAYLGYVSLCGLLEYMRRITKLPNYVLVRDTRSSLNYRVGKIKIV